MTPLQRGEFITIKDDCCTKTSLCSEWQLFFLITLYILNFTLNRRLPYPCKSVISVVKEKNNRCARDQEIKESTNRFYKKYVQTVFHFTFYIQSKIASFTFYILHFTFNRRLLVLHFTFNRRLLVLHWTAGYPIRVNPLYPWFKTFNSKFII